MLLDETYDIKNFDREPTYIIYKINDEIAGCNSGHMCRLYVFPKYRKQGIAVQLLKYTINKGIQEKANLVWSYPRFESWSSYRSAGFELKSMWEESETGLNAYCTIKV
jgi:GNAT superfamily N-acetyltransferase